MKEKDLVSFGNYLLDKHNITEEVTHADLENWKHDNKINPFSGICETIDMIVENMAIIKLKKQIIELKKQTKLYHDLLDSYKKYIDEADK